MVTLPCSQAPYWPDHCRLFISLNALSIFSLLLPYPIFLFLFTSLLWWWVSSRGKTRNPEKVEYFDVPSVFLLQFDIYQTLCLFELRFCFASCLLDCNSGPHLRPESPDTWNIMFTLRAREERLFSEKRKSRQPTLQRTEPEPLSKLPSKPEGPNEEPYCSLSFENLCRKREVGKTILFMLKKMFLSYLGMRVVERYQFHSWI